MAVREKKDNGSLVEHTGLEMAFYVVWCCGENDLLMVIEAPWISEVMTALRFEVMLG